MKIGNESHRIESNRAEFVCTQIDHKMSFAMVQSYYIHFQWVWVNVRLCSYFTMMLHILSHPLRSSFFLLSRLTRLVLCIECENRNRNFFSAFVHLRQQHQNGSLVGGSVWSLKKTLMHLKCKTWAIELRFDCLLRSKWGKNGKSEPYWFNHVKRSAHSKLLLSFYFAHWVCTLCLQRKENHSDEFTKKRKLALARSPWLESIALLLRNCWALFCSCLVISWASTHHTCPSHIFICLQKSFDKIDWDVNTRPLLINEMKSYVSMCTF